MIVDPDFLDHWKTRMLVDSLGSDELAPIYIIRLWAHCQQRRMYTFDNLTSAALRAICRYKGDVDFESAMTACGYVSRDESGVLEVCGWAEYNATLIANWKNGKLGGRPRKEPASAQNKPMDNPPETHGIPMANPSLTHGEPIRLDTIRDDKEKQKPARKRAVSLPAEFGISQRVKDWAKEKGFGQLEAHLENFLGYARAKGATYVDWDDAFMNAIRNNWAKLPAHQGSSAPNRWAGLR